MPSSPLARRAQARASRRAVRRRAPKHPKGPEANLRFAVARLFDALHAEVKRRMLAHAAAYLAHKRRRRDADDGPRAPDPMLASVFHALWAHGLELLHRSTFTESVRKSAQATAKSVAQQTKAALELDDHDPDLSTMVDTMTEGLVDRMQVLLGDSIERGADVLDEWAELDEERSERAGDLDALGGMLDVGLDGIAGTALGAAGLAFNYAFGQMVKASQLDAGVSKYMWESQLDSHVRPEHAALDGETCSWDDPPLKAIDSSLGEDCHPGEDANCRCVAAPMDPDGDDEGEGELLLN